MVFVLLLNDGQFTLNSVTVLGVYDKKDIAILNGWKTLITDALQPWTLRFYTKWHINKSVAHGLGMYYIEEWDMTKNIRVASYTLGEKIEHRKYVYPLDDYLKQNNDTCESILRSWHHEICNNVLPPLLHEFTYCTI